MISLLRSTSTKPKITRIDSFMRGCWVRSENPTEVELNSLESLGADPDVLRDALDPHEVPRVEQDDDWTYFFTRVPAREDRDNDFTTPVMIGLGKSSVLTVSKTSLGQIWEPFISKSEVATTQKMKLFMLMVEGISSEYQSRIAAINRQVRAITKSVKELRSEDIIYFVEYERKLNDFMDALIPTNVALEKILSGKYVSLHKEDEELVEDLSIDFEQLISRCKSLLRTITNIRDSYRTVMDIRLNATMRTLTIATLAISIPTMVAGIYGMNVTLPGPVEDGYFSYILMGGSIIASLLIILYFTRKK